MVVCIFVFQPAYVPPPTGFYPGPPTGAFPPPTGVPPGPFPGAPPPHTGHYPAGYHPPGGPGPFPPHQGPHPGPFPPHPSGHKHVVSAISTTLTCCFINPSLFNTLRDIVS